jgi:N-acetyl sugar amidotransferase
MTGTSVRACTRCLYDSTIPGISFDDAGVCSYCALHDAMDREYPTGEAGARILRGLADEMRAAGRGRKYDCVVGVSGGCDSSYLIHQMVELGLRPLAVHFDNTWNSPIATQNIYNVLSALDVDLETLVVNNKEYDDLYRSFMLAGVRDIDAPTDIALAATLYRAAEKHGVRYIVEGHSFRTEGISPLGWLYMDGKYIESVQKRFGTRPLETYPNLPIASFLRWATIRRIRRIRPLYYVDYQKEEAKRILAERYGWEWYGGHHLENRFTAFYHSYFMPTRWQIDQRVLGFAALIRSGQMTRDEGLALMREPPQCDPEIIALVKKRLGFSDEEFREVMTIPRHHYSEFATYKRTFERLRPFLWVLYKFNRLPKSFYTKFARPDASVELWRSSARDEAALPASSLYRAE